MVEDPWKFWCVATQEAPPPIPSAMFRALATEARSGWGEGGDHPVYHGPGRMEGVGMGALTSDIERLGGLLGGDRGELEEVGKHFLSLGRLLKCTASGRSALAVSKVVCGDLAFASSVISGEMREAKRRPSDDGEATGEVLPCMPRPPRIYCDDLHICAVSEGQLGDGEGCGSK